MNVAVEMDDVRQGELLDVSEAGPAPKRIIAGFGFWIFLLSDIVMFSALFAATPCSPKRLQAAQPVPSCSICGPQRWRRLFSCSPATAAG